MQMQMQMQMQISTYNRPGVVYGSEKKAEPYEISWHESQRSNERFYLTTDNWVVAS